MSFVMGTSINETISKYYILSCLISFFYNTILRNVTLYVRYYNTRLRKIGQRTKHTIHYNIITTYFNLYYGNVYKWREKK